MPFVTSQRDNFQRCMVLFRFSAQGQRLDVSQFSETTDMYKKKGGWGGFCINIVLGIKEPMGFSASSIKKKHAVPFN